MRHDTALAPAAVQSVQVSQLDTPLTGLDNYERAFVVFRHGQAVVGQAWLPVIGGRVAVADLRGHLPKLAWPIWQRTVAADPPSAESLPSATVAVCTRDRTEDLAHCLPGLDRLAAQGHDVLVVDNRPSNERTRELVERYERVRYVRELKPGADAARNRALREARGAIVAFTDDDAIVDEGWLDALRVPFRDPVVAITTGITMPLELEEPSQVWFEQNNSFGRGFLRREYDIFSIEPLASGLVGASVNMAVRRSALRQIGLFDEALDGGTASQSGGDHEFFYRALVRGYRVVYEPSALVWHRHRRDWDALRRCIWGYGVGLFAWWTRAFLVEHDWTVLKVGLSWFVEHHVREAARALLRRPGAPPLDIALAELRGALAGPGAYLRARRELRRQLEPAAAPAKPSRLMEPQQRTREHVER